MSLEIENFGISDEALDNFREFMEMVTAVELPAYLSLDLQCPVCLDLLYKPHSTKPCRHIFCETCLRRLSQAQSVKCPICRTIIRECCFNEGIYSKKSRKIKKNIKNLKKP